ncbi:MAG: protein kinase [Myxococcaceae bacterium]|nr:protein kinase [Myxococcaceae bacterium]
MSTSVTPTEPTVPEIEPLAQYLNHFRLDKELASGGMGAVYLGFDESLQRPVAIKLIRPELAREQGFLDRFIREARAQAQVTHSNVVQVYFVGQEKDVVFIAMELVDGGSLAGQRIGWKDALKHLRGLAEGLREAARLNIIHRDIKPANILLDRFGLAHIADFGLAAPVFSRDTGEPMSKTPTKSASLPVLTQVGSVMGSPPYMSPEQARGDQLDVRTDIYALGATFYELLAGKPATSAVTLLELERFMAGPPPPTMVSLQLELPRKVAALIDKCMERDLKKRFQTYDELIEAIDAAAPRPIVPAPSVPRMLSWLVDVAVFAAVARVSLQIVPVLGFLALFGWVLMGVLVVGSTPGQWMMRLKLRRPPDLPSPFANVLLRFVLQHGWLAFASLTVASIYQSSGTLPFVYAGVGALLFLVGVAGSVLALFSKERRTLADRLSGTRVLVDVGGATA